MSDDKHTLSFIFPGVSMSDAAPMSQDCSAAVFSLHNGALLERILCSLASPDLARAAAVCTAWRAVAARDGVWRLLWRAAVLPGALEREAELTRRGGFLAELKVLRRNARLTRPPFSLGIGPEKRFYMK